MNAVLPVTYVSTETLSVTTDFVSAEMASVRIKTDAHQPGASTARVFPVVVALTSTPFAPTAFVFAPAATTSAMEFVVS